MQRHPLSERFHQLIERMGDLHDIKQLDYGAIMLSFLCWRCSRR